MTCFIVTHWDLPSLSSHVIVQSVLYGNSTNAVVNMLMLLKKFPKCESNPKSFWSNKIPKDFHLFDPEWWPSSLYPSLSGTLNPFLHRLSQLFSPKCNYPSFSYFQCLSIAFKSRPSHGIMRTYLVC